MLGATHACANPLTAHYGTTHGVAIAVLLPHVVRWNWTAAEALYRELAGADLADRLAEMADAAGLPSRLRDLGVPEEALPSWPKKPPRSGPAASIPARLMPPRRWRSTSRRIEVEGGFATKVGKRVVPLAAPPAAGLSLVDDIQRKGAVVLVTR